MEPLLYGIGGIILLVSILILALAFYIHFRKTQRFISNLNLDELKRAINNLEQKTDGIEQDVKSCRKEGAETKIKTTALEDEIRTLKEENSRYLDIFKTVLYGFDYIVQGCKKALEIGTTEEQPEEKRITANEENTEEQ